MAWEIIRRRHVSRFEHAEYAVVKRDDPYHPYVSCTITPHTISHREWYGGHYFKTLEEAIDHWENR